jgi:hypothetical protein
MGLMGSGRCCCTVEAASAITEPISGVERKDWSRITCDNTNVASRKIIEANGGAFENELPQADGKPSKLRFWIELA